jgi:hypothetical protein
MGLLIDYFLANGDDEAAAVIDWPAGPANGIPKKVCSVRPCPACLRLTAPA